MLADIKQINKVMFQRIKIHNSIYVRWCLSQVNKNVETTDDYLLVFIIYKLSIFDHSSFGITMESFWSTAEERFFQKLDSFSLIQRKSMLYSFGKCIQITKNTHSLFQKLLNLKTLQNQKHEPMFLEYFGKILLSGVGRCILEKKDIEQILPFIKQIMEDFKISKQEKVQFLIDTSVQFYRLGIYEAIYWNQFFKYENDIIQDRQSFFPMFFISQTIPAFADDIENKQLLPQFSQLNERIRKLPHYQNQISQLQSNTTSSKQSLFEMRFGFFLTAFGKQFEQEKIVDDVFSVDFFISKENIAVEIEGNTHFIKQIDGTSKQNLVSKFKRKYLQKLGINVIQLGQPTLQKTPTQHVSILRDFQSQYNLIMSKRNDAQ